jgi:hypothetical protein
MAMATDLRMGQRYLATQGVKGKFQGMTLEINATPEQLTEAIMNGYAKFGF